MSTHWIAAATTPIAVVAAWLIYQLSDLDSIQVVRRLIRWSARVLIAVALLVPPAGAAAFAWIVAREQERLTELVVEPMLDGVSPPTSAPESTEGK